MKTTPSLDYSPVVAIWEVTRACDLACRHCRASAVSHRDRRELSTTEAFDLLDQMRALDPGTLVLTGGDPFKRPDLFALVEAAVQHGLTVAVAPSVTPLLTTDALHQLAAAGVSRIALSLDGPDGTTHDALRGISGSYERTLAALAGVRAAGLPLQVNTSLTRATADRLAATGQTVADIAPALWSVFVVVPVGRATEDQQLDAETCERVFHFLCDWRERTGLPVKTTAAPAFRRVLLQREAERARAGGRRGPRPLAVNDGKGFVFVSHTGEVFPSGFLPLSAGNVRETPLPMIYRQSALFRDLRDAWRLEGKCGRCPFQGVCGGSRARAYAATGNPFASDPACVYEPPEPTRRGAVGEPP